MFFYCHYINKGFKPEYLYNLPIYTKTLFMAAMDIELEKELKYKELQESILEKNDAVYSVMPIVL